MTHPVFDDDEDDQPLDPAVLRLQQKMRRLVMISGAIMRVGLFAVFSVIIYRVVKSDGAPRWQGSVDIQALVDDPLTDEIVDTSLDGRNLAITMRTSGGLKVLIVDVDTLTVLRRMTLVGKAN